MTALLARLQASLGEIAVQDRERVRVAPFTAYLDHARTQKYYSFALPDPGASPEALRGALPGLDEAFAAAGRTARIEHVEELNPPLRGVLEEAGWALSEEMPALVCGPADLIDPPPPEGVEVRALDADTPDAIVRGFLAVQKTAFRDDVPVHDRDVELWRNSARRGFMRAAFLEERVVGTAWASEAVAGVSEIGGVATLPEHQRRGIAAATTAAAARDALAAGAELVWLTAAGEDSERIYGRAGFGRAGTLWAYDSTGSARGAMP